MYTYNQLPQPGRGSRTYSPEFRPPVQMLKPGKSKTHRAYLWTYVAGVHEDIKSVVYDFCESRAGANAKAFFDE